MKRRFLLAALCASGMLLAQQPTLEQILQRHYEAMGGVVAMKAANTVIASGKAVVGEQKFEMAISMKTKRPDRIRLDMTFQGNSLVQAYDGAAAWQINPFAGASDAQKMASEEATQFIDTADMDGPLVDYKAKGHTLELIGKEDMEGSPAYKIKVLRKSGRAETYWIDVSSYLILKTAGKVSTQGQVIEMESFPGNYKKVEVKVDGKVAGAVMMPFSYEQKAGGKLFISMSMDNVEANVPMDDADFKMPVPKPAEAKK